MAMTGYEERSEIYQLEFEKVQEIDFVSDLIGQVGRQSWRCLAEVED